jgi:hypothetical protein
MTRRQYKKMGMHYSVLECAQRDPDIRAELVGLLDLIGRARRAGMLVVVEGLWACYRKLRKLGD